MSRTVIYPGSFDPMTLGHIDIVQRGLRLFDRVIVAIAVNRNKAHMFSLEERLEIAQQCLGHLPGIELDVYDELLVHYCARKGVNVLLRGLRAVSDFEYEFQLASMNRKLSADVETVFMMTSEEHFYLSSSLVREIATYGGDVSELVPEPVLKALKKKLG